MSQGFHCAGPTVLQIKVNPASGSYETLGRSNNEDLVGFEFEELNRSFTRNDLGDMKAEVVLTGSRCLVSATLEYWDESVWEKVLGRTRLGTTGGSNEGYHAEVGRLMVGDRGTSSSLFSLNVLTSKVGEKSYECKYAMLLGHRMAEIGNTMKRLVAVFEVLPDEASRFYTPTVNT